MPAQSPQNVVSNTMLLSRKCESMSQLDPPVNCAVGFPHADGLGAESLMSLGILPRAKNQRLMALLVHSIA